MPVYLNKSLINTKREHSFQQDLNYYDGIQSDALRIQTNINGESTN